MKRSLEPSMSLALAGYARNVVRRRTRVIAAIATTGLVLSVAAPAHATFPGHNGRIAFYANRGEHPTTEIYSVNRAGTPLVRLTHEEASALHEAWSPDGKQIVFEVDPGATGCNIIEIMKADGTDVTDLTRQRSDCEREPSFTPDGRRIVFSKQRCDHGCTTAIWSMELDGSDRRRITRVFRRNASDPNVSPDGRRLIFTVTRGEELGGALYGVDMHGGGLERVVPFSLQVGIRADWSPDGSRIVFTQNLDEEENLPSPNVDTVRPDGSDLIQLTHVDRPEAAAIAGAYSPDGRWILFRKDQLDKGAYTLWKMHPDGTHRTRIARMRLKQRGMDWAPRPD